MAIVALVNDMALGPLVSKMFSNCFEHCYFWLKMELNWYHV